MLSCEFATTSHVDLVGNVRAEGVGYFLIWDNIVMRLQIITKYRYEEMRVS